LNQIYSELMAPAKDRNRLDVTQSESPLLSQSRADETKRYEYAAPGLSISPCGKRDKIPRSCWGGGNPGAEGGVIQRLEKPTSDPRYLQSGRIIHRAGGLIPVDV
jgi:hypothetical protein